MKNVTNSLLLFALCVPMAQAAKPTPWDRMPHSISGSVSVTTKDGKKHKARGAEFTPSKVTLEPLGESFSRADVKQVVIRQNRDFCCDAIYWPEAPFVFGDILDGPAEPVALIVLVPVEAGLIAISLPVAAVQGIKRLVTPAKILYQVVP